MNGLYADMWRRQKEAADEIEKFRAAFGDDDLKVNLDSSA